jgi:hypothetical protein
MVMLLGGSLTKGYRAFPPIRTESPAIMSSLIIFSDHLATENTGAVMPPWLSSPFERVNKVVMRRRVVEAH